MLHTAQHLKNEISLNTSYIYTFLFRRYGPRDVRRAKPVTRLPLHRPILRSTRTDTDSRAREILRQRYLALDLQTPKDRLLLINIPAQPEVLVKRFDLKTLTKYVNTTVLHSIYLWFIIYSVYRPVFSHNLNITE